MSVIATALALQALMQEPAVYTTDDHIAWIRKEFRLCQNAIKKAEDDTNLVSQSSTFLGKSVAIHRQWQNKLSAYLSDIPNGEAKKAFEAMKLAGLFDTFLSSAILSMDGSDDSRELRIVAERRIQRLLVNL